MSVLTGLIGYPTEHSLSPAIHAHWMQRHGIAGDYKLFTTPHARLRQTVLRLARKDAMRGFNITVPHKESVLPYLDHVDGVAARIGAVNTVVIEGGQLHGTNTDAYGFLRNLEEGCGGLLPDLSRVVILGAGGAARAAAVALKDTGAQSILLSNRTRETAESLAAEFAVEACGWDVSGACLAGASLIVNTTSLGMKHQPPLNLSLQHAPGAAVIYDIVYHPLETSLLKAAKARGNRVVDGLGMLLYQAQKAFALWHGIEPAVDAALRRHVLQILRERGDA